MYSQSPSDRPAKQAAAMTALSTRSRPTVPSRISSQVRATDEFEHVKRRASGAASAAGLPSDSSILQDRVERTPAGPPRTAPHPSPMSTWAKPPCGGPAGDKPRRNPSVSFFPGQTVKAKPPNLLTQSRLGDDGSTIKASKNARRTSTSSVVDAARPFSPLALANAAGHGLRSLFGSVAKPTARSGAQVDLGSTSPTIRARSSQTFWQTLRRSESTSLRKDKSQMYSRDGSGEGAAWQPIGDHSLVARADEAEAERDKTDTIGRLGLIPRTAPPPGAMFRRPTESIPFPATESESADVPPMPVVTSRLRTFKRSLTLFRSPKSGEATTQVAVSAESGTAVSPSAKDGTGDMGLSQSRASANLTRTGLVPLDGRPRTLEGSKADIALGDFGGHSKLPQQPPTEVPAIAIANQRQGNATSSQGASTPHSSNQDDHFDLRIAVMYLVKTVLAEVMQHTIVGRHGRNLSASSASGLSDDDEALRSVLEERLRSLQRMERAWGSAWLAAKDSVTGLQLSERTRQREARTLREALRDGVILCFLINRLQGPLPPLIPKVHLHDLQASRDANIRAFVLASRGLAIGSNDTMQPGDISDTASSATQRIVTSILALARLAGPQGSEPGSPNLKFSSQNAPTRRQVVPERVSGATPISRGTPRNIPPVVPPTRHRPTASNSPEDSVSGGHGKVALSKELPGSSTNGQLAGQSTLRSADKPLAHVAVAQKQADVPATKGSNRPTSSSMERSTRSSTPSLILSSSNARTSWTASEPAELRDSGTGLSGYRYDLITSSRDHLEHSQYFSTPVKIPRLFDTMLDQTAAKIASKTTDVDNTNPGQPVSAHVKESPPRRQPIRSVSSPGVPSLNSGQATPSKTKGESVVVTTHGHTAVYQLGNIIGRGQFGTVWRCLDISTGQIVAIKRISIEGLPEYEIEQLLQEVELLHKLNHPGIVRYEGMSRDKSYLNIVLEYIEGGSLGATVKAFGSFNETLASSYAAKIIEALSYLHASDVVHLDLKAANILTTKRGNLKLSDFGVSLSLRAVEKTREADVAGSPNWMAPEVIELKGATTAGDIWSLGCTIIELITGRPPYADLRNDMAVMFRIVEDGAPPFPEGISDPLRRFLGACFRRDPLERPAADDLFKYEWVQHGLHFDQVLSNNDSIPFLRRISVDGHRPDSLADIRRYMEQAHTGSSRPPSCVLSDGLSATFGSPQTSPRTPAVAIPEESPKHSFVRTRFGTVLECRLCAQALKRNAMICSDCGLICHSTCAYTMVSTCTPQAGWTRSRAGSPDGTNAVRFRDSPTPIRVRPALSRISLSTPTVAILGRRPSQEDGLPDKSEVARSARIREETLAKLSGVANDRLTEFPSRRRSGSPRWETPEPPAEIQLVGESLFHGLGLSLRKSARGLYAAVDAPRLGRPSSHDVPLSVSIIPAWPGTGTRLSLLDRSAAAPRLMRLVLAHQIPPNEAPAALGIAPRSCGGVHSTPRRAFTGYFGACTSYFWANLDHRVKLVPCPDRAVEDPGYAATRGT